MKRSVFECDGKTYHWMTIDELEQDKEVQKKAIGDQEPITCRPADLIKPQLPEMEKACAEHKQQDEDVLSYALFPQVALDFFKERDARQHGIDPALCDRENKAYPV